MFKYILVFSLQYFVVLSMIPQPDSSWWPQPQQTSISTSTQSTTTCPSCIAQINEECNVKTNGCNNRDCCDGLICQLYNPNIPDLGGTCQCQDCQSLNQSCLSFSLGCNRVDCCPGLKCVEENPGDIASDRGGFCRRDCSKCKEVNKRCLIYAEKCSPDSCCRGLICGKSNSNLKDGQGVCRSQYNKRSCPKCQTENEGCFASVNSCVKNHCCDDLLCVKNMTSKSIPDVGGVCTKLENVPREVKPAQKCGSNTTCNYPGEPCLGININTCAKNPCCDSNLFHCVSHTSDKPGVCQRIPVIDAKLNNNYNNQL